MSTEHQQYSIHNQIARIRQYAEQHGLTVIKTYADEGKSGLDIEGRPSLQQLINDVLFRTVDFTVVLVYDVSRWGRFQDPDESAYYEYLCRRAGIKVAYCAEPFDNDGSPLSSMCKGIKRVMAGEYSRELSTKVFAGQCRGARLGFKQGGSAGFGLRRLVLDKEGKPRFELAEGEQKALETDRVILVPGPASEVKLVRQIFRWFVHDGVRISEIVSRLNARGSRNAFGRPWIAGTVYYMLINEKYTGTNVYNRTSKKLLTVSVPNPRDAWIRKEGAFTPIVPKETFDAAQAIFHRRRHGRSDIELLDGLRQQLAIHHRLTRRIIDDAEGLPSTWTYEKRFGSLAKAFRLAGGTPSHQAQSGDLNRELRRMHPDIVAQTVEKLEAQGASVRRHPETDLLEINDEIRVSLVVARCWRRPRSGNLYWRVYLDPHAPADLTVAVRLTPDNQAAMDYFLMPRMVFGGGETTLWERNPVEIEKFRFDSLDFLYGMAARLTPRMAA